MFEPAVNMSDIVEYVGHFQRPFVEGEAILKAKHLMECGTIKEVGNKIHYLALCLQTSKLDGKPHEVNVIVDRSENSEMRIEGTCSCKAGSGHCKHVVAVLLYLSRQSIEMIEDLSCTEITQQWGKIKTKAKDMYHAKPARQFCHTTSRPLPYGGRYLPRQKTDPLKAMLLDIMLNSTKPGCAIAMHDLRRTAEEDILSTSTSTNNIYADTNNYNQNQQFIRELVSSTSTVLQSSPELDKDALKCCTQEEISFYSKYVDVDVDRATLICYETSAQVGDHWMRVRKPRITGSKCYEIYTYCKPSTTPRNWENKMSNLVFNTFSGNAHTSYGLVNEPIALNAYVRQTNYTITKAGIIINPLAPWLGYSPDGFVSELGRLIEVKCLQAGKTLSGLDLARAATCLNVSEENVTLKRKHKYYGQVQMGMLVTGLHTCDFLLYSKCSDENLIVQVPYDEDFAREMICTLRTMYFKTMLPFITVNANRMCQ